MANQKDVADFVAANENISKASAERIVKLVFDYVADEIASGNEVAVAGFGKFTAAQRAERQGHNPATGASITIAAKKAPKFSPAKALKDKVEGK